MHSVAEIVKTAAEGSAAVASHAPAIGVGHVRWFAQAYQAANLPMPMAGPPDTLSALNATVLPAMAA